jgi:Fic family protein
MADSEPTPLSADELARIDSQYKPFPSFGEWPDAVPREDLWVDACDRFAEISNEVSEQELQEARQIALRAAAFDTGAIERLYPTNRGLTISVATQATAWEQLVREQSAPDALALFEAQLAAFELVLDQATEHFPKVTQTWVRRLHEEVTAAQETYTVQTSVGPQEQPLPRGQYKTNPNHVKTEDGLIHAYAPVEQVQAEMQRLVDELDSESFRTAHPILQAAYAHYAFVVIHPFADGNGRVARALASAYTYRSASVPLLVLDQQRDRYFALLAKADGGDAGPFVEFIGNAARNGIEMVIDSLRTAQVAQPDALLSEFRDLYVAQGGLNHQQLDGVIGGFTDVLGDIIASQIEALRVPDGVTIEMRSGSGGNHTVAPPGYRQLVDSDGRILKVMLRSAAPAEAASELVLDIFASSGADPASTVLVQSPNLTEKLKLGLDEIYPEVSGSGRYRMEAFVRRILSIAIEGLLEGAKENLNRTGYR